MTARAYSINTLVSRRISGGYNGGGGELGIVDDESISFEVPPNNNIQTLSNYNPYADNIREGLLYVPVVDPINSGCDNNTLALIPANVTRENEPETVGYDRIAIAPWTNPECVQSYLSSMRDTYLTCAIFFHPDDSGEIPPPVSDPIWDLGDGGRWTGLNEFPVYAIPGTVGTEVLYQMGQYSGNVSSAPFGEELSATYNASNPIRLYVRIAGGRNNSLPSLWVFLIIVLAVLLAVVLITSIIMHLIQRRQRSQLARRVARGEVDLEVLGIKRLNVPQELIDKMPQYTYTSKTEQVVPTPGAPPTHEVPFSQPICPICLDDFVHGETIIRELPCNHVFHPECIDAFLLGTSSLCPMCKKSSLPTGYCPVKVTNIMVRRERLIRRTRERNGELPSSRIPGVGAVQRRFRTSSVMHSSRAEERIPYQRGTELTALVPPNIQSTAPTRPAAVHDPEAAPNAVQNQTQQSGAHAEEVPAEIAAQGVSARRAWLRERLARRQQEQYNEQAQVVREVDVGRPLWRKIAGYFFHRFE